MNSDGPKASSGATSDEEIRGEHDRADGAERGATGDTFGVGVHVTERELQFVVHVPSEIDSGWTDPETFQQLVERVVWAQLDQESTLRAVASSAQPGETVTLGTVTLRPDGTVVDHSLSSPATPESTDGRTSNATRDESR